MNSCAVIDASPLILLSRAGYLHMLRNAAESIVVPASVACEVRKKQDIAAASFELDWIHIVDDAPIPPSVHLWGLGPGESAVIACALARSGAIAVLDDFLGRRCAEAHGIKVSGTLGTVLQAKVDGRITSARLVLHELVEKGLYLSPELVDQALKLVQE